MPGEEGTFVVTGSNAGLGLAISAHFLASSQTSNIKGLFGARNPSGAAELRQLADRASWSGQKHEMVKIDLSTLEAVRTSAESINARVKAGEIRPIRALVLNAAMQQVKGQTFTKDGFEQHFGVNYLANFLLTLLLLPSMDRENGRIVIVSSWTHDVSHPLNGFIVEESHRTIIKDDIEDLAKPRHADKKGDEWNAGMRRYGGSKTLMVTFMHELQRRLLASSELQNISVVAVDPGTMPGTSLFRDNILFYSILLDYIMVFLTPILAWWNPNGYFRKISKSAADIYNASFDETTWGKHPKSLYLDGNVPSGSSPETRDESKQKRLWDYSVQLTGIKANETNVKLT